jgi:predicted nuclease of predicted toxin-antitoxin system
MPRACVALLRQRGHDVLWVREAAPGLPDPRVLARALSEGRLLITFDKDFGELVFRRGAAASCGIVLFRIAMPSAAHVAQRVAAILESRDDWSGSYSVVDDTNVRLRPLPATSH